MLISRFFTDNFGSNKKKRSISESFILKLLLFFLVIILFFYFLISFSNNNFNFPKFDYLNKVLIKNGFKIQNVEINDTGRAIKGTINALKFPKNK